MKLYLIQLDVFTANLNATSSALLTARATTTKTVPPDIAVALSTTTAITVAAAHGQARCPNIPVYRLVIRTSVEAGESYREILSLTSCLGGEIALQKEKQTRSEIRLPEMQKSRDIYFSTTAESTPLAHRQHDVNDTQRRGGISLLLFERTMDPRERPSSGPEYCLS
ncbi:hypothetical protein HL42_2439 [Trichophyton rubrum]|nr:hypothetical protein HL42_2439 [Trichophyton rubrum]